MIRAATDQDKPEGRRGMIAREWAKEKARTMRAAMGLPDDPRLERRS